MDKAMADGELQVYRQRHDALLESIDRQAEQSATLSGRVRGMLLRSRTILEMVRTAVREADLTCLLVCTSCAVWNAIQDDMVWRTVHTLPKGYAIRVTVTEAWLAEMVRRYGRELWQVDGLIEDEGLRQTVTWDVLEDYVQLTNRLLATAEEAIENRASQTIAERKESAE